MAEKLDTSLLIRLSKTEKSAWQEKALLAGMPLASLVRQAMKKATISKHLDRSLFQERTCQIRRIGINLNQIAKWANTYKTTAEAIEIIEALKEIELALNQLTNEKASSFPSAQKNGGEDDVS
ncbi:MobC family plasmid mobilization relaxosome protein [Chroococcus sp. FPU101]|uniref:MobC family plasmid mobilization relaxosome protein n=1 Tax=Chroococcus sp. FPU101 TaxID=1974212 RepID=UPI001AA5BAE5|nr:MobC family plasmid mobilization relaxosome protein [Chroococcus sp. FPU101]GFE72195.1 mobilisation protein [Chroococcus sp. FPU101]